MVARVGKAPVLLVHGNGGAADVRPWDLLDQRRFLLAAGYPDELIWAPSYLGTGTVDLQTPHTNNVDDVRNYLEAVCDYLDVDVVDVIAHSLGCTLMYSVFRGLDRQTTPISWDQPKKWARVGTFVSLAGAFHGLGTGSIGEWRTGGEFMNELLAETEGGGGETPFGGRQPADPGTASRTPSATSAAPPPAISSTRRIPAPAASSGATNRSYNLGSGTQGHQAIKESQAVFNDFLPLLNSVPPVPAVVLTLDPESGPVPGAADRDASPSTRRISTSPSPPTADEAIRQRLHRGNRQPGRTDDRPRRRRPSRWTAPVSGSSPRSRTGPSIRSTAATGSASSRSRPPSSPTTATRSTTACWSPRLRPTRRPSCTTRWTARTGPRAPPSPSPRTRWSPSSP